MNDLNIDPNEYNSASSVHNYMLNDPILDILKLKNFNEPCLFLDFILNKGKEFEKAVVSDILKKIKEEDFVQISYNQEDILKNENYVKTINEINKGTPIIYQGVLHDHENKIYGSPDLIIRSDYLKLLFDEAPIYNHIEYVIVDIKFCAIYLSENYVMNKGRSLANKGQVLLYSKMLSKRTKTSNIAYIVGRSYRSHGKKINKYNAMLGRVDTSKKELVEKVDKALEWLKWIKLNINSFSSNIDVLADQIDKSDKLFIRPNMKNTYDIEYHKIKTEIAKKIHEITLVWGVFQRDRLIAHENGITKWSDPKFVPKSEISKAIIKSNLEEKVNLNNFRPKSKISSIKNNLGKIVLKNSKLCFFIDFETISSIFDDFSKIPYSSEETTVFMIGVLFEENYYNFCIDKISKESETEMVNKFHEFINDTLTDKKVSLKDCLFYHWGQIEKTIYNKLDTKIPLNFVDLCTIAVKIPLTIKGSFDFSLKELGKALINNGVIFGPIDNWTDKLNGGLDAMIMAEKYYSEKSPEIIKNIIEYNKIDCIMLYRIHNLIN